jgi:hypothetical protein
MKVLGRAGSQNCAAVAGSFANPASFTRTSMTIHGSSNTKSSNAIPRCWRTVLEAPSQPMT